MGILQGLNEKLGWLDGQPRKFKDLSQPTSSGRIASLDGGLAMLRRGGFLSYCTDVITDYHSGDTDLVLLLLRSSLRAAYSSPMDALIHVSLTGASGAGKNDLLASLAVMIPKRNLATYNSIAPQALFMATQRKGTDARTGKPFTYIDDKAFLNKVILVTEVANSKSWDAMKAFSELDESQDFTHATSQGTNSKEMTITGPRGMFISSVLGPKDDQVLNRFVHIKIEKETKVSKAEKFDLIFENSLEERSIYTDDRTQIARAMYAHLFNKGQTAPQFAKPNEETTQLWKSLSMELGNAGFGARTFKQFLSLAKCAAFEKSMHRGYTRVEQDDILESWYLLKGFREDAAVDEIEVGGDLYLPKHPLLDDNERR